MNPASSDRLVVVWRVTEACDLRCAYCGYSGELPRRRAEADLAAVLAWGRVLGDYAAQARREVMVSWLGGEPLGWPGWQAAARKFRQDYGLGLSVTTNGTRLEAEAVRQALVSDFAELTLSLDGPPAVHDGLRQAPGLSRRLERGVRLLRELRDRQGSALRLRLNAVLMRETVHALDALCRIAAGWGFDLLTFNGLGGRDRPEFFPEHRLLPEHLDELRAALPGLRSHWAAQGLTLCGSEQYLARLAAAAAGRPVPVDAGPGNVCQRSGEAFWFVDESGWVSPCSYTSAIYGRRLADLAAPEALRALPEEWAQARREALAPACGDCPSTQVFGKFWYA